MNWSLETRYSQLDALLADHASLWHPQPFKEPKPAWCEAKPALAALLLALPDDAVVSMGSDNRALTELIGACMPALADLSRLIDLPKLVSPGLAPLAPGHAHHLHWEVPGRKAAQIEAFASQVGRAEGPFLEWCGGKGHLGRLLGAAWQVPVATLERDATLSAEGEFLARRAGVAQVFHVGDALAPEALADVAGRHALALHACGDLHVHLIRRARGAGIKALDVAPCCHYRTATPEAPALSGGRLQLDGNGLRLAVMDTVIASPREVRFRQQEQAWKLAFIAWRRRVTGEVDYKSFKPVPDGWLRGDFASFCGRLAQRQGLPAPFSADCLALEEEGWRRAAEVARLSLVRLAFRRALETWLALDRALFLQAQGYELRLGEFCSRQLTPRNLLISAR